MILHVAGTSDARELALLLQANGFEVLASVVTESAANGLAEAGIPVRTGRMDAQEMSAFIRASNITAVVDASHPFAEEAHKNAMAAAHSCQVPYIRFERGALDFSEHSNLYWVADYREAAEKAAELKGNVMLTTGSKTLQIFTKRLLSEEGIYLIARMLPRVDNLEKCAELGLQQKQIIAMQGPFSKEFNRALYQQTRTDVVITKESGQAGAVDEKVEAALELGLKVIVIRRPELDYGVAYNDFASVLEHLQQWRGVNAHGI